MSLLSDLRSSPELLTNLTRREVKGKYKRTVLGQLWSLVNPLAQMLIFTAVFSFILRMQPAPGDPSGLDAFAVWLLCALLPWAFFVNVINGGMGSLVGNQNLIQKVAFPRVALPVSNALSVGFTWGIEMTVLLVVLLVLGANALLWLPGVLVAMVAFARRVAHLTQVTSEDGPDGARTYRVTGALFFASSNDLVHQFAYTTDPAQVTIDLSGAHVWDASSVATLDAITTKYAALGKRVTLVGLNEDSSRRFDLLAGRLP